MNFLSLENLRTEEGALVEGRTRICPVVRWANPGSIESLFCLIIKIPFFPKNFTLSPIRLIRFFESNSCLQKLQLSHTRRLFGNFHEILNFRSLISVKVKNPHRNKVKACPDHFLFICFDSHEFTRDLKDLYFPNRPINGNARNKTIIAIGYGSFGIIKIRPNYQ